MNILKFNHQNYNLTNLIVKTGKHVRNYLTGRQIINNKINDDLVTKADLYVENCILSYIRKHYPDHGYDSEEAGQYQSDADYIWILDPIDGTKYFSSGIPLYSISLALEYKKKLIQGIVYIPETQQLFYANHLDKQDALLNNRPIHCGIQKPLTEVDICLEIPNRNSLPGEIHSALERMKTLVMAAKRVRIIGVGSIGLCYCAMGGFNLYLNLSSRYKYCDYAAGKVIVEKAGGEFRKGENYIIAGNKENIAQISGLLNLI